ncbi:hypothetical protein CRG98_011704, partial [Punica granatum]
MSESVSNWVGQPPPLGLPPPLTAATEIVSFWSERERERERRRRRRRIIHRPAPLRHQHSPPPPSLSSLCPRQQSLKQQQQQLLPPKEAHETVSLFSVLKLNPRKLIGQRTRFNWIPQRLILSAPAPEFAETADEIERITKLINDHPFPQQPLHPILQQHIPPQLLSNPFVENVLGRLFAAHSNGLKALEFFWHVTQRLPGGPSVDAFEKTLHILTRMRYFDQAWELMEHIRVTHPSLLTLKSMSIMLSRIAKFKTYEETLEAFDKMEKDVFVGKFGTEEFNVLLRAFCTQRMMKEARSVFNNLHSRFSLDTKSANILLLGFKESGDVTAVEFFYHEIIRRGFKPNSVTYDIRIDVYCKKGCLGDALRLFEEMERVKDFKPTVKTITTLIHGAGVARNPGKAWELFDGILLRNMTPDIGAYNALISSM